MSLLHTKKSKKQTKKFDKIGLGKIVSFNQNSDESWEIYESQAKNVILSKKFNRNIFRHFCKFMF